MDHPDVAGAGLHLSQTIGQDVGYLLELQVGVARQLAEESGQVGRLEQGAVAAGPVAAPVGVEGEQVARVEFGVLRGDFVRLDAQWYGAVAPEQPRTGVGVSSQAGGWPAFAYHISPVDGSSVAANIVTNEAGGSI